MDEEFSVSERWIGYLDNSSHKEIKQIIKDNINRMCADYISIGYCLKKVNDRKLYLDDGYSGIGEYAEHEFGLKDSKASKLIKVIEELCVNGNSPVLREEYKEFTISKLEEIIYLDEEQREEISPKMTMQEIRKVKTRGKVSAPKIDIREELLERVQGEVVLSKEVDEHKSSQTKDSALCLDKNPIYCIDGGGTCSSYQKRNSCDSNNSTCPEFTDLDGNKNFIPEAAPKETANVTMSQIEAKPSGQCIHRPEYTCTLPEASKLAIGNGDKCNAKCCWSCQNHGVCGYECNASTHRPEVSKPIEPVPEDKEVVIKSTEPVIKETENVITERECRVETLEADNIEILSTEIKASDAPIPSHLELAKELLKQKQERLNSFIRVQAKSYADRKYIESRKVEVGALAAYIHDFDETKLIEPVQPDLPKLKNNDQRKEFIDNYSSWPVWIDQNLTGERYHRYDLTDKVAMVVKVNLKHSYENYKETKTLEYGVEQYYLLGIKAEWSVRGSEFKEDSTRTFYECGTNKSALVEYLKEFQKGQVN